MSRTDDDTWDITSSVGATALGVAYARAIESAAEHPLIIDRHAQQFITAAAAQGWQPSRAMTERLTHLAGYAAARTKWFDDFFVTAGANGLTQAVILAAGLDSRAWRLPWPSGSVVFELDQPLVLAFKAETLREHRAQPAARYVPIGIDLRQDWPKALRESGFDECVPTAWAAEGLLAYLPAAAQDLLFERVHSLSAPGSRFAVESFGPDFFAPEQLAKRQAQLRQAREAAGEPEGPDVADLWFAEARTDVADWLAAHDWETSVSSAADLMQRYRRELTDLTPRTCFVAGHFRGRCQPA
jgi:methyltransferase (TIGR00027 family)